MFGRRETLTGKTLVKKGLIRNVAPRRRCRHFTLTVGAKQEHRNTRLVVWE